MKKGVLVGAVAILIGGLIGCAVFDRPVRARTLETRPIAPSKQERIKAIATDAEAAAAEQRARMSSQKSGP